MVDGVQAPKVLLPSPEVDLARWSVIACDQFTAQSEYWVAVEEFVGDAPSTYRLIYPEACLLSGGEDRTPAIHAAMDAYLKGGVFREIREGFVLTERTTASGIRIGLMVCIDLSRYDFTVGSRSLIRPTEKTIFSRIPPRIAVRKGAILECPHIMLLFDDPRGTLIEPLYAKRSGYEALYGFELMFGGGHLRGWLVADTDAVIAALAALPTLKTDDPILFAVGDGNHSLATARQCYLDNPSERTRYALVEIVNLYNESLVFEPIHRLIEGVEAKELQEAAKRAGVTLDGGDVRQVQPFLDAWLPRNAKLDYIHGEEALTSLASKEGFAGIRLSRIKKESLFPSLHGGQVLPRKSFSMGRAEEKRYYMECRLM